MLQPGVCQGEDLSWVLLAMCLPLSVCHPLLTLHRHMQPASQEGGLGHNSSWLDGSTSISLKTQHRNY